MSVVPAKYPDTWFVGTEDDWGVLRLCPGNVTTYSRAKWEACFLAGVAAGMVTETNKVGWVGGVDYATIVRQGAGLELGAKWINPDVEFFGMFEGTWVDVEKGYETAKAVLAMGVDVLGHYCDNAGLGVFKAGEETGVWLIGESRDQHGDVPDLVITSILTDHSRMYERALLDYKAGVIRHTVNMFDAKSGWPSIAPLTNVSQEVKDTIAAVEKLIIEGKIVIPEVMETEQLGKIDVSEFVEELPPPEEVGITPVSK